MKAEILKSCDLYPYYDYAYGYGVPQAAYFTNELKPAERSFELVQEKDGVKVVVPKVIENQDVFINVEGADGVLLGYYKVSPDSAGIKLFNKDFGQGKKLNVSYNGFYESCPISGTGGDINLLAGNRNSQNGTFKEVKEEGWQKTTFFQYDYNLPNDTWKGGFSRHFAYGRRWLYGKSYKIGGGLGLDFNRFVTKEQLPDAMEVADREITMRNMQLRGELLQRVVIRLWGINWDLGVYGGINALRRVKVIDNFKWQDAEGNPIQPYNSKVTSYYNHCKAMNLFEYGATTRISYSIANMLNIGVYGSYRLSPVITKDDFLIGSPNNQPSPWSVGIEFELVP